MHFFQYHISSRVLPPDANGVRVFCTFSFYLCTSFFLKIRSSRAFIPRRQWRSSTLSPSALPFRLPLFRFESHPAFTLANTNGVLSNRSFSSLDFAIFLGYRPHPAFVLAEANGTSVLVRPQPLSLHVPLVSLRSHPAFFSLTSPPVLFLPRTSSCMHTLNQPTLMAFVYSVVNSLYSSLSTSFRSRHIPSHFFMLLFRFLSPSLEYCLRTLTASGPVINLFTFRCASANGVRKSSSSFHSCLRILRG